MESYKPAHIKRWCMQRAGHVGFALLAYVPVLAFSAQHQQFIPLALFGILAVIDIFLPISIVTGWNVSLSLAMLPDIDLSIPGLSHRGITHTIWFALFIAGICGGLGYGVATLVESMPGVDSPRTVGAFCGYLGLHAIVTHLLADMLTPMGVKPFWPLSNWHYTVAVVRAANEGANRVLYVSGIGVTAITTGLLWLPLV